MTRNKALTLYGAYKDGKDVMPLLGKHPNIVDMGGNRPKAAEHTDHHHAEMMAAAMDEKTAKEWTGHMENPEDPSKRGEHWSMAQTTQLLKQMALPYDPVEWYAVLNMMYSDYFMAAKKFGLERNAEFYAELAKGWLEDDDVAAGKRKTVKYYREIVV